MLAPEFTLVKNRADNGAPWVKVRFSDGYTDTLILEKHFNSEEDELTKAENEECNFIGHLAREKSACVAMTGCPGTEDVEFTIFSAHAHESPLYKWAKNGSVVAIENPFNVCKNS